MTVITGNDVAEGAGMLSFGSDDGRALQNKQG